MSAVKRRKVSAAGPPVPAAKPKYDLLYDQCVAQKGIGALFSTQALMDMGIAADGVELHRLCEDLVNCHLFAPYRKRGNVVEYRTRAKEEALK
jgi:hypothetical protein